jgi:energy-coupling factor transporter ATP-binding protein EcfA2
MADMNIIIRPNPFPGLRAFRPDEGHLFFGRMESTIKVTARLKETGFVAVLGASGSGKSSLVLSGVIPALLKENAEAKKAWSYLVFRPDHNPVDRLAAELSALSAGAGFTQLPVASVAASLHNRSEGLTDVVNKMRKNLRQQIVIVIDQFEELFRYSSPSGREQPADDVTDFIDLLVNAAHRTDEGLYIIMTIRSEYVSECSRFHSLTNLMNSSSYLLPQIPLDALTSVIEDPVRVAGASIDRSLVKVILSDLTERPGQLPVLQHLLMRLWNQWSRSGDMNRPLSVSDYEAVGQLKGAISQHAGQALESLDERHRYVASRIFRSITARTDDGRELRKPERIISISRQTGCTIEEIIQVAEVFRSPEYSFITPSKEVALTTDSVLDITHESIIRLWSMLRKWMDDEEASRKLYLQLARAAEHYQEGTGKLWTAPDLLLAVRWREENNPTLAWAEKIDPAFERTMLFLRNSEEEYAVREEYRRKTGTESIRRSRLIAGILGLMALITLIALGTVFSLRNKAEKQKSVALQIKDEALAFSDLLSDSLNTLQDTLKTASMQAELERENSYAAETRAAEAEEKAAEAARTARESVSEKAAAVAAALEESRRKMLAVATSLSVRSLNYSGEKDLQILLARQAYIFNDRYSGTENDPDLFLALYEVGKRYGNSYYSRFLAEGSMTAMAEDPARNIVYTADSEGQVLRWQSNQDAWSRRMIWSGDKIIRAMTISPDASWLACGTETSEIVMIPLADDSIGYTMSGSGGGVTALIFSSGNNLLWSSRSDGTISEWDLVSHRERVVDHYPEGIAALEMSADHSMMAALTREGKVLLWNMAAPGEKHIIENSNCMITAHRFLPRGNMLVTGDSEGSLQLWNALGRNVETTAGGHPGAISCIACNFHDEQIATADDSGEIRLWSLSDMSQPPVVISDSEKEIVSMTFTDQGNAFLAAAGSSVTRRPAHVRCMTGDLCDKVTRNLTEREWNAFVGRDIEYEPTCPDKALRIRVREIIGAR